MDGNGGGMVVGGGLIWHGWWWGRDEYRRWQRILLLTSLICRMIIRACWIYCESLFDDWIRIDDAAWDTGWSTGGHWHLSYNNNNHHLQWMPLTCKMIIRACCSYCESPFVDWMNIDEADLMTVGTGRVHWQRQQPSLALDSTHGHDIIRGVLQLRWLSVWYLDEYWQSWVGWWLDTSSRTTPTTINTCGSLHSRVRW